MTSSLSLLLPRTLYEIDEHSPPYFSDRSFNASSLRLSSRVVIFLRIYSYSLSFFSLYILRRYFYENVTGYCKKAVRAGGFFYKRLLRTDLCDSHPLALLGLFAEEKTEKREDEEHSEVCNYYACTCGEIVGIVGYRYTDNVADAGNNRRADRYTAEASEYSH